MSGLLTCLAVDADVSWGPHFLPHMSLSMWTLHVGQHGLPHRRVAGSKGKRLKRGRAGRKRPFLSPASDVTSLPPWSPQFTQMQKEGRRPHLLRRVSLSWDVAAFGRYRQPQDSWTQTGMGTSTLLGRIWFWTKVISRLTSDWV